MWYRHGMSRSLAEIVSILGRLANLDWAEPWDNVGLLLEPKEANITKVLVTIDLTEPVLCEAQAARANLIVAYHPPIFDGFKRLTQSSAGERIILEAIRSNMAIYSPHTALDAAPGGMNDWLAQALGNGELAPIVPLANAPSGVGLGRIVQLDNPTTLDELLRLVKQHLGLQQLRVAVAPAHAAGQPIRRAAVCAGAGGSVFEQCPAVDLLLTGEMRHHDVLSRVSAGTSVILTDHTNTERGYLPHLANYLKDALGVDAEVVIASSDRDPLAIR
jgi:dinuclear metal center YbgI/SA1388 family protein